MLHPVRSKFLCLCCAFATTTLINSSPLAKCCNEEVTTLQVADLNYISAIVALQFSKSVLKQFWASNRTRKQYVLIWLGATGRF